MNLLEIVTRQQYMSQFCAAVAKSEFSAKQFHFSDKFYENGLMDRNIIDYFNIKIKWRFQFAY